MPISNRTGKSWLRPLGLSVIFDIADPRGPPADWRQAQVQCPRCGNRAPREAAYCPHCGTQIVGSFLVSPGPTVPVPPLYPATPGAHYYYPYPPPKRDHLALIIVLIVVVVVLLPLIAAALLYVMVSGLIGIPTVIPPTVTFGPVTEHAGNATIPVAYVSGNIDPGSLQVLLQANHSQATPIALPGPNGGPSSLVAGGRALRVYWTDADNNSLLSSGDSFSVTGEAAPLPTSTVFTFILRGPGGPNFDSTEWTTP